ncbi:hypothetical protein OC834_007399, partial [Tilletia horrida]
MLGVNGHGREHGHSGLGPARPARPVAAADGSGGVGVGVGVGVGSEEAQGQGPRYLSEDEVDALVAKIFIDMGIDS